VDRRGGRVRYVEIAAVGVVVVFGGALFLTGFRWGLPSAAVNRTLFGDRPVWSGRQVLELAGTAERRDRRRGADVDVNPIRDRDRPVLLNATDVQRAELIRRYRLYTYQPDEMTVLMALASMRPSEGDFDPKLYQYGGLFLYPVGAMLGLLGLAGVVTVTTDQAYYLDRPEEFGKFYLVPRGYSAAFGLVGAGAVYWLARRMARGLWLIGAENGIRRGGGESRRPTDQGGAGYEGDGPPGVGPAGMFAGLVAACLYVLMPVVLNMAHEGKPHLPGAVVMLYAVMAATMYVERGTARWAAVTGVLCGAALGMVLSSLPIFVVLPVMVLCRRERWARRAVHVLGVIGLGAATYLITNPYIAINLVRNREVLRSNFANSLAMYTVDRLGEGFVNVVGLVAEGTSPLLALVGMAGVIATLCSTGFGWACGTGASGRTDRVLPASGTGGGPGRVGATAGLLYAPAVLIFVQFVALGAGKPGEYGRFALLPDVALGISAAVLLSRLFARRRGHGLVAAAALLAVTGWFGSFYLVRFVADERGEGSRAWYRDRLAGLAGGSSAEGALTIGVFTEPAPYSLPPVNLFENRLILLPRDATPATSDVRPDVVISPVDDMTGAPLESWAAVYESIGPDPLSRRHRWARISWAGKPFVLLVRPGIAEAPRRWPGAAGPAGR